MSGVTRIAVVGAGLAGLSASTTVARLAKDAANRGSRHRPFQITLIDKSRSVGGRMATRRVYPGARAVGEPVADEHIAFDTGAQLLRVRDEEFQKLIGQWTDDGRVDEFGKGPPIVEDLAGFMADWKSGTVNGSAQPEKATDMGSESKSCRISGTVDSNVKYFWRGPGGMNAFVKKMADEAESLNVNIKLGSEVDKAEYSVTEVSTLPSRSRGPPKVTFVPKWTLAFKPTEADPDPTALDADILLMAAPMMQTVRLLERGGAVDGMDKFLLETIRKASYSPTLAFLLPYSPSFLKSLGRPPLPDPYCFTVRDALSPIYWVSLQSPRRSSDGQPTSTGPDGTLVFMNADFSKEHYEKSESEILQLGLDAITKAGIPTDLPPILKKWRYANLSKAIAGRRYSVSTVKVPLPAGGNAGLPLILASDAFSSDLAGTNELDPQLGVQRAVMSGIEVGKVLASLLGVPRSDV